MEKKGPIMHGHIRRLSIDQHWNGSNTFPLSHQKAKKETKLAMVVVTMIMTMAKTTTMV